MIDQIDQVPASDYKGESGKILAIVSGKGGSGKTMFAVALAQGAALADRSVVLVDADFATGGLSYYLTFREFKNARIGLSDILDRNGTLPRPSEWTATGVYDEGDYRRQWLSNVRLIPVGDQRRFHAEDDTSAVSLIQRVLSQAKEMGSIVIVDCRGGIDSQSLAVCELADEVVIVVETDTTSIRASQHLVDVVSTRLMKNKISGFILNKVMDDPTSLAKAASSLLGVDYLGSIPFDIEATRSYIQGRIPEYSTLFSRHAFAIIPKIFSDFREFRRQAVLSPEEFSSVTLRSPEVRLGGIVVLSCAIYLSVAYIWLVYFVDKSSLVQLRYWDALVVAVGNALVVFALSDSIKQSLGRVFRAYSNLLRRMLGRRSSTWR